MATLAWIRNMLDKRQVPYQEIRHEEVFTAQELAQIQHISGHRVAKVIVVIADDHPVELVLPASRRVLMHEVKRLLNAHEVRLATEAELAATFTGCELGAVPPLPHWKGVRVLMDEALATTGEILFQAGTHQDAIRLDFADWLCVARPQIDSFSEPIGTPHDVPLRRKDVPLFTPQEIDLPEEAASGVN